MSGIPSPVNIAALPMSWTFEAVRSDQDMPCVILRISHPAGIFVGLFLLEDFERFLSGAADATKKARMLPHKLIQPGPPVIPPDLLGGPPSNGAKP